MGTNQLYLAGVIRSFAKIAFAGLFGFLVGFVYGKSDSNLAINVDESITIVSGSNDYINTYIEKVNKELSEQPSYKLIGDATLSTYTRDVLKERGMNMYAVSCATSSIEEKRDTKQKVTNEPELPPPRVEQHIRSDLINTS